MNKKSINTSQAPQAIGTYSQAIKTGELLFVSGQIPLDPHSMTIVSDDFTAQAHQVFKNLLAVLSASGCSTEHVAKLTVYMTDLSEFTLLNEVMSHYFKQPYPARAAVEVSALPKAAKVEIEAIANVAINA